MKCYKCGKNETAVSLSTNFTWTCPSCHFINQAGGMVNIKPGVYNFTNPKPITGNITIIGNYVTGESGSGTAFGNTFEQKIDLYDWINDNIKSKTDEALLRFKSGIISANELRDLFTGLLHD
jgi:hypothetical protein